jgi:hypothetical protein
MGVGPRAGVLCPRGEDVCRKGARTPRTYGDPIPIRLSMPQDMGVPNRSETQSLVAKFGGRRRCEGAPPIQEEHLHRQIH